MHQLLEVIEHRGVRIMTGDFSGLPPAVRVSLFAELADEVIARRIRLIRLNGRDTVTSEPTKQAGTEGLLKIENALGPVRISIIGLTGIQRFVATIVVRAHCANSEEDANDWLADQAAKLSWRG